MAELRAQGRYDPPPGQSGFSGRVLTAAGTVSVITDPSGWMTSRSMDCGVLRPIISMSQRRLKGATALLLIFLIRAMRDNRRNDFIIAGLVLGFSLYVYQAARMLPLVVMIGWGINHLVFRRG